MLQVAVLSYLHAFHQLSCLADNRPVLVAKGCIDITLDVLRTHKNDKNCANEACSVLANLTLSCTHITSSLLTNLADIKEIIKKTDAASLVKQTVAIHPSLAELNWWNSFKRRLKI